MEVMGDILGYYPEKEVYLCSKGERLCGNLGPSKIDEKWCGALKAKLEGMGGKFFMGGLADVDLAEFDGKSYLEGQRKVLPCRMQGCALAWCSGGIVLPGLSVPGRNDLALPFA